MFSAGASPSASHRIRIVAQLPDVIFHVEPELQVLPMMQSGCLVGGSRIVAIEPNGESRNGGGSMGLAKSVRMPRFLRKKKLHARFQTPIP